MPDYEMTFPKVALERMNAFLLAAGAVRVFLEEEEGVCVCVREERFCQDFAGLSSSWRQRVRERGAVLLSCLPSPIRTLDVIGSEVKPYSLLYICPLCQQCSLFSSSH